MRWFALSRPSVYSFSKKGKNATDLGKRGTLAQEASDRGSGRSIRRSPNIIAGCSDLIIPVEHMVGMGHISVCS